MSRIDELIAEHCPEGVVREALSDVAKLKRGTSITKKQVTEGNIPVVAGGRSAAYLHGEFNRDGETIVVAGSGAYAGFVSWWEGPIFVSDAFSVQPEQERLLPKYCFHWLSSQQAAIHNLKSGGGVPHVYAKDVGRLLIPIPPLEVQRAIVEILDTFSRLEAELEAELEARKQQYEHYRAEFVEMSQNGTKLLLGEIEDQGIVKLGRGKVISKIAIAATPGDYPVYSSSGAGTGEFGRYGEYMFDDERITWSVDGGGRFFYRHPHRFSVTNVSGWMTIDTSVLRTKYLYYVLTTQWEKQSFDYTRKAHPSVIRDVYSIAIPPLERQDEVVERLDKFDALVNDLSIGLPAELTARRQQYEYYRDKLLTFKELEVAV